MGFFTKERIDSIKAAHNAQKERQVEIKKQKSEVREYKKEKRVRFEGTTLQPIGVIPKGGEVVLKLDPDAEVLCIKYDKNVVKLPYDRILGFRIEYLTEERVNKNVALAGNVLSSGVLGRGLVGTAGRLAGGVMMALKKKKAIWIGILVYKDKFGETQELSFAGSEEELEDDDTPVKNPEDKMFEQVVNGIATRGNQDLLEL